MSNLPAPSNGGSIYCFWACRPCGPAGWLALLLTKTGDVETNPGPTTLNKKVWICDICHKQIHVRKQISKRCNRIEHWVHLRCAGIHSYTHSPQPHLTRTTHQHSRHPRTLTLSHSHSTHMQHKQQYMHHSHRNNHTHSIGYYDNLRPRTTT